MFGCVLRVLLRIGVPVGPASFLVRNGRHCFVLHRTCNMRTWCGLKRVVGSCVGSWLAWVFGYFVFYVVVIGPFLH